MLKFIFPVIMLMSFSSLWGVVQTGLIMTSVIFLIFCYYNCSMFMLGWSLGVDKISFIMILLSIWIVMLVILISQKYKQDSFGFCLMNLLLLFFLIMTFCSLDYMLMYIMFEACLVPTLILILGWGYQPERIQAGVYMFFYTLFFSLPLLLSFIMFYNMSGSLVILLCSGVMKMNYISLCWFFITIGAFLVKLPIFMLHLWLPKAHVEAPLAGSMLLAGVLLKLGGYGLLRVLVLFQENNLGISWVWVSCGLIGGSFISFLCLRQIDIKSLIAYSSVAHMSMVFCGLMIMNLWGLEGAVIVMVGHGLCSSGLFCLANIMYERVGSRSMFIGKGLLSFMPSMGLWWFLLSVSNMASPPSLNLLGEISLMISLMSWSNLTMVGLSLLSFFSAAYTLYMYTLSQHGVFYNSVYSCCSGTIKEYLNLFLHWFPLNILIINSNLFLSYKSVIWKVCVSEVSMISLLFVSLLNYSMGLYSFNKGLVNVIEWEMFSLNSNMFMFTLVLDWISFFFCSFVFLISGSVMFYSKSYMSQDKNKNRFLWMVLLFVSSMMLMILSPNLISILLGWDGLGLVSFGLVIFYQNEKSANAGMLTVLSNRVGDVAILLSISLMSSLGSWNFFLYGWMLGDEWDILKLLMMLAALTKSAQIPFSAWLPAAMAAPTPVSALVHSSTLVTAGIYLMIRFSEALVGSYVQSMLLIISSLTMFMAGLGANFEYDLKKIIALSTLSQLGVMMSILALGMKDLAFFHLLTHALFKALLFMCAGVVIHTVGDIQDIRYMGGLSNFLPYTISFMMVANLALCGFPFLAGFYSKDMIIEMMYMGNVNLIVVGLYVVATMMTVMYTMRLLYYMASGEINFKILMNLSDSDETMNKSMVLLVVGAMVMGSVLSWVLFPEPYFICMSMCMKYSILVVSFVGGYIGYMMNIMNMNYILYSMKNYSVSVMSGSMWFMPFLSTLKISKLVLNLGSNIEKVGDKGWSEKMGGLGLISLLYNVFNWMNILQLNNFKSLMKVSIGIIIFMMMM